MGATAMKPCEPFPRLLRRQFFAITDIQVVENTQMLLLLLIVYRTRQHSSERIYLSRSLATTEQQVK